MQDSLLERKLVKNIDSFFEKISTSLTPSMLLYAEEFSILFRKYKQAGLSVSVLSISDTYPELESNLVYFKKHLMITFLLSVYHSE